MRGLLVIFFLILLSAGCSKEENIPFKDAETATITPVYYHKLDGRYVGTISEINFISDNSYEIISSKSFYLEVTEQSFDYVEFNTVSGQVNSSAVAEVGRLDDVAYLRFEPASMTDSLMPDSVFFGYYNGIYVHQDQYIEYFLKYKNDTVITHEVFRGYKN